MSFSPIPPGVPPNMRSAQPPDWTWSTPAPGPAPMHAPDSMSQGYGQMPGVYGPNSFGPAQFGAPRSGMSGFAKAMLGVAVATTVLSGIGAFVGLGGVMATGGAIMGGGMWGFGALSLLTMGATIFGAVSMFRSPQQQIPMYTPQMPPMGMPQMPMGMPMGMPSNFPVNGPQGGYTMPGGPFPMSNFGGAPDPQWGAPPNVAPTPWTPNRL